MTDEELIENFQKLHELPESCTNSNIPGSEIQEFFRGANVLITGSSGFMGTVTLEKLLASCPNIEKIYVIIREKKGKTIEQRVDSIFNDLVYERVKKTVPNFRSKVVAVKGDYATEDWGLSPHDYKHLTEVVNVIFNIAACVNFQEILDIAVKTNTLGVRELLKFSKKCTNLKSVVHFSTAYSNCTPLNEVIEEKFYPKTADYKKLIQWALDDPKGLAANSDSIIRPWPNTYSYTKKLAEDMILEESDDLPICLFRPGIVLSTYKEPLPGWLSGLQGFPAQMVASYLGFLRLTYYKSSVVNIVPVDLAVNAAIAAAWQTGKTSRNRLSGEPTIYAYTSTDRNPLPFTSWIKYNRQWGMKWPSCQCIRYPFVDVVKNIYIFYVLFFLLHTVPAILLDGIMFLIGKERRFHKISKKILKTFNAMSCFVEYNWNFKDGNTKSLSSAISPLDKIIFPFDIAELSWFDYAKYILLGLRTFVLKEPLDTREEGKKMYKRQRIIHYAIWGSFVFIILYLLSSFWK